MDKLERLINSLGKAEKRYFKLNSAKFGKSSSSYLQLFESIDKQTSKKEVAKNTSERTYLYKQILGSLEAFSLSTDESLKSRQEINFAKILYKKNLHRDCWGLLKKIERKAKQNEDYLLLLDVYEVYFEQAVLDTADFNYDELESKQNEIFNTLQVLNQLRKICQKIYRLFLTRGKTAAQEMDALSFMQIKEELFSFNVTELNGFQLKYYYHFCCGMAELYEHGMTDALVETQIKRKELFLNDPSKKSTFRLLYFQTVSHYLSTIVIFGKAQEVCDGLNEILKEKLPTEQSRLQAFSNFSQIFAKSIRFHGGIEQKSHFIEYLEDGLSKYNSDLTKEVEILLLYEMAAMYFVIEDYKSAKKMIGEILNQADVLAQLNLQVLARVLNVMVYYELNDRLYVPDLVKSAKRFIKAKKLTAAIELLALEMIGKLCITDSDTEKLSILKSYEIKMREDSQSYSRFSFYLNLNAWIESKVNNVTYISVLENNVTKIKR